MTRKHPEFEPGETGVAAAQPEKALAMQADLKISGSRHRQKPNLEFVCG